VLLKCFAGCNVESIVDVLGLKMSDLFPENGGRGRRSSGRTRATARQSPETLDVQGNESRTSHRNGGRQVNTSPGITLHQYAEAKGLPVQFLRGLGLTDIPYQKQPALRIPYVDQSGSEAAVRFRLALSGGETDNRFVWKKGSKPLLYGLNRKFRENYRIIVEGESDCHTAWYNGFPAIGLPGATNWNEERDAHYFDGCDLIYVIVEPDQGGDAVKKWLSKSRIRDRVKLISIDGHKDPSALYLADPVHFKENFERAMADAVAWADIEREEAEETKTQAWAGCSELAQSPSILDAFSDAMRRMGVVGEDKLARLLYLIVVSRYLEMPCSAAIKGPSSGGKSYVLDRVLGFFPPSAYYSLTSMSEHALAYSEEPLSHRMLVIYEAAGLSGDFASYLVRSLLSEGRVRYETVEKTKDGLKPRLIEREGPTGLLVTTTSVSLHPENETRMLSLTVSDTADQTKAILKALAEGVKPSVDLSTWHALSRWLDHAEHRVDIPYALKLAELIPGLAVRLRRDFKALLNLIHCHAILHQVSRERDADGRIVANLVDYGAVRDLVGESFSDGIGATVSPSIRKTVEAVENILSDGTPSTTVQRLATALHLDKSSALRRVRTAIARGYLVNNEKQKGRPYQITLGDPVPEDIEVLPSPEKLECCSVAGASGGISPPPPSEGSDDNFVPEHPLRRRGVTGSVEETKREGTGAVLDEHVAEVEDTLGGGGEKKPVRKRTRGGAL
jgi:hypothetical protein